MKIIGGKLTNEPGKAGCDIHATESGTIYPGERKLISTGLTIAINPGTAGIIKPHSGLAVKFGIDVLAGVIDSSYRGEVKVLLINHGDRFYEYEYWDRIAQLIVVPCFTGIFEQAEMDETERGDNGFGSSGK